jgi:hypothetical protein
MAEGAQVAHPEPAMAAQFLGTLFRAHHCDLEHTLGGQRVPAQDVVDKWEPPGKGVRYSAGIVACAPADGASL